jgi:uncharacterized protein (UPF0332 family)
LEAVNGKALAQYRLDSAEERLKAARLLLEKKMYADAASRSYYAVFQAARAALATKGLDSRKHSGIIGLFNQQFVKTGVLPKDYGKILKSSKDLRQASDYDDFYMISREEALAAVENATRFIRGIKLFLRDDCTR